MRRGARRPLRAAALLAAIAIAPLAAADPADVILPLDAAGPGWRLVQSIAGGVKGGAARFADPRALIDAGPCGVTSAEPFTLVASIRTTSPEFSTAIMARDGGGAVGCALVMGREPGRVSFEAWSWASVKLVSRTRVDDGKWHRVEAPYDPTTGLALLFVDDRLETFAALGAGGAPGATLRLGNNIGADQPYRGDLDEVALLRRTTHADRFAAIRRAPPPVLADEERRQALAALRARLLPKTTAIPRDVAAWDKRRAAIRAGIADALGLVPEPPRGPLDVRVHGAIDGDGFRVERVTWNSWPGARAMGWLWTRRPAREGRGPAILSPHGHWAGGAIDPVVQTRAATLARL